MCGHVSSGLLMPAPVGASYSAGFLCAEASVSPGRAADGQTSGYVQARCLTCKVHDYFDHPYLTIGNSRLTAGSCFWVKDRLVTDAAQQLHGDGGWPGWPSQQVPLFCVQW